MRHHDHLADADSSVRVGGFLCAFAGRRQAAVLDSTILLALLLVLASAVAHATWNLLLKSSRQAEVFAWWLSAIAVLGALPVALPLALTTPFAVVGIWFVIASALVHVCYFLFLGRSLSRGDLSLVYPIARGFGPGLVPVLAVFALGETVSVPAWAGIAAIVVGIYTMAWWGQLRNFTAPGALAANFPAVGYALLTGVCISLYTLIDKRGVAYIHPFLYLYLMTCGVAVGWLPYIIRSHGVSAVVREWRAGPWAIIAASSLLFLAYGLVLTAMTITDVSYVAPAREVGLLIALGLGAYALRERVTPGRVIGAILIVAGLALITLFR